MARTYNMTSIYWNPFEIKVLDNVSAPYSVSWTKTNMATGIEYDANDALVLTEPTSISGNGVTALQTALRGKYTINNNQVVFYPETLVLREEQCEQSYYRYYATAYRVRGLPYTSFDNIRVNDRIECAYKGQDQVLTLPFGFYKFECWGASTGKKYSSKGGLTYGGYTVGEFSINEVSKQTLHLQCGGAGVLTDYDSGDVDQQVLGGYNGGGKGTASGPGGWEIYQCYSGGGATHIAFSSGLLSDLRDNRSAILMVAGGAGGIVGSKDDTYNKAGAGGGNSGGTGNQDTIRGRDSYSFTLSGGGSQNSGGAGSTFSGTMAGSGAAYAMQGADGTFGKGGDAALVTLHDSYGIFSGSGPSGGGGGGGGYYGGGGGSGIWGYASLKQYGQLLTGGGGSGYISNLLSSASTVQQTSSTTNPDTENYAGYIRITPLDFGVFNVVEKYKGGDLVDATLPAGTQSAILSYCNTMQTLIPGYNKKLKCKNKYMLGDIVLQNGPTIKCAASVMEDDITVIASKD